MAARRESETRRRRTTELDGGPSQLFSDTFLQAVHTAAERVSERIPTETDGPHEEREVLARMDRLVHALASGDGRMAEAGTPSEVAGYERLLDMLYAEVIRDWSQQPALPTKTEMLMVLDAFQRVRQLVSPASQAEASLLWAVPHDADLVVELAHDLRSPLTSIIFLTEALRGEQGGTVNDLQKRQLGIIYSAALSLVSMASDVIELARGGSRLLERRPSPFSIGELLESTTDILKPVIEEKALVLRTSAPEIDHRLGHPVALSRVLLNPGCSST
jgi:signal transduction histidine kinase